MPSKISDYELRTGDIIVWQGGAVMSDELLNCPFCGGEVRTHDTADGIECASGDFYVRCDSRQCPVRPCGTVYTSEDAAIAAWNKRPSPAAVVFEGVCQLQRVMVPNFDGPYAYKPMCVPFPEISIELPVELEGKKVKIQITEVQE
jgi:hypothetical protein